MRWLCVLLLCACGRVGFAPHDDGSLGGGSDGAGGGSDAAAFTCAGFQLCEDFEGPTDPAWTSDPSVVLDSTIRHRGASSMRMHMSPLNAGQQGSSRMWETVTLSPVPSETWVRAWMRMSSAPTATNALELISIDHDGGGGAADYVFSRSGAVEVFVEPQGTQAGTPGPAPTDTWFCLVFHVVFSTTTSGSLELTGTFAPPAIGSATTNDSAQPVDTIGVGPYFSGTNVDVAQPAFDVWVDDVIVHDSPVTCAD
jgi:hypothetical protein